MPDDTDSRPRKTKLEKIAELEAKLKASEEENRLLQREVHRLKGGGSSHPNPFSERRQEVDPNDVDKMKTALKSLKRVTVKQEMILQSMRESANERRKQLQEKDGKIARLKQQLRSMEKSMRSLEKGDSVDSLQRRIRDLEARCFDEKQKNADLSFALEQTESKARHLEKKMVMQQKNFSTSMRSISSNSSETESNISRMKQELAKKSSRIVSLEYELEATKDELLEIRRQSAGNGSNPSLYSSFQGSFQASFSIGEDGFPTAPPMGADPFKTDPFLSIRDDENLFSSSEEESDYDD